MLITTALIKLKPKGHFKRVVSKPEVYAPVAIKPACPSETKPVFPIKRYKPDIIIILIHISINKPI